MKRLGNPHWSDEGLPIGVQLVAAFGREDLLLRVAAQLEADGAWRGRRPPDPRLTDDDPLRRLRGSR
ncbi:MAG: hypothetical protein ABW298_02210 [Candidatus Binatia bacterium]